jgi:hypothetical protein
MSRLSPSNRPIRSKKPLFIILGLALLAGVAGVGTWLLLDRNSNDTYDDAPFNPLTEEETRITDEIIRQIDNRNEERDNTQTVAPSELDAFIPFAGFNGERLMVTTRISGNTTGECRIVVRQGSTTVHTETAPIENLPNSSECAGFLVDGLNPSGNYQVSITIESCDGRTTTIEAEV